ncbi:MAG TPA: cytochrome b/b6 domain-containing protein [Acidimicrobiia bacterium]|nr:cytochrome b/b6 domain-containing protein [Acidimicrobiia bacterium]
MSVVTIERTEALTHHERFNVLQRILHGTLMVAFLGLAATGMPLRFNQARWSIDFAAAIGGFDAILVLHKLLAVLLTLTFIVHLGYVSWMAFIKRKKGIFRGPTSMVPQLSDVRQLITHFKWFVGRGERPAFGRFTYWEKFDYLAVFWGMFAIGITGYVMWFSEAAARILPGWAFNVSLLIHSEEALLAVWYIFAIHFFNSHLRPGKFPMDTVIFTGRESLHELAVDRPSEYSRLVDAGVLEKAAVPPPPRWLKNFGHIIGTTAIVIGFALFGFTVYAFVTEGNATEVVVPADRVLVGPSITPGGP